MTWVYDQKLYKRVTEVQKKEPLPNTERATTASTALTEEESTEIAAQSVEENPREDTPISEIEATCSQTTTVVKRASIDTFDELMNLYIFAHAFEFPFLKIDIIRQCQSLCRKGTH